MKVDRHLNLRQDIADGTKTVYCKNTISYFDCFIRFDRNEVSMMYMESSLYTFRV